MPQEDKKPVQITITAAGDHADRTAVHDVVNAVTTRLDQPEIAESVTATIVTKIKKG